jgi:short-subunit dehydrogenase
MELKGKRIVITGASAGIGLALSKRLIKSGARVVCVARNEKAMKKQFGNKSIIIPCDISDSIQLDAMFKKVENLLGGIDIFIANAGFAYYGTTGEPDWEKDKKIFLTNVVSPIYCLQRLSKGRIEPLIYMVTISGLGKMVLPGFALYNSTKFALDAFIRTYRMEKPKNIKVIPVYPVAVNNKFFIKAGGADTPVPYPRQSAEFVAWCMEVGLKVGARSVYTSIIFILRCLISRVFPIDLFIQGFERIRLKQWRFKHNIEV